MAEKFTENMEFAIRRSLLFATASWSLFSLPIFDEICRRSMNFIKSCISHSSVLIRSITFSRYNSVIGHDLFYAHRYNCLSQDVLYGNVNGIIHNHSNRPSCVGVEQVQIANFLYELIMITKRPSIYKHPHYLGPPTGQN